MTKRPSDPGGGTVAIGTSVERLLAERGLEEAVVLGMVVECWSEVVGEEVANQVVPVLVRSGELVVRVGHPAWATELDLAGAQILKRLETRLGAAAPTRLTVRVGYSGRR